MQSATALEEELLLLTWWMQSSTTSTFLLPSNDLQALFDPDPACEKSNQKNKEVMEEKQDAIVWEGDFKKNYLFNFLFDCCLFSHRHFIYGGILRIKNTFSGVLNV